MVVVVEVAVEEAVVVDVVVGLELEVVQVELRVVV